MNGSAVEGSFWELRMPVVLRTGLLAAALLVLAPGFSPAAEWYVICDLATGQVAVSQAPDEEAHRVMDGPFPGERTASIASQESCPEQTCDRSGECGVWEQQADQEQVERPAQTGGWVAGEVTSVTLGSTPDSSPVSGPGSPGGPSGPGAADLSPIVDTAKAAARGCSFPAALASAEHITNFDPENPWYVANHDKLKSLSKRQKRTEQLVWRASTALTNDDLKGAREMAAAAADSAVSCQTQAVSQLLEGIDTALDQRRRERDASRRAAAAALLPSLIDLSRAISGGGSPAATPSYPTSTAASATAALSSINADPCAFKFIYKNKWSTEPTCTCPGYVFNGRKFQCSKGS